MGGRRWSKRDLINIIWDSFVLNRWCKADKYIAVPRGRFNIIPKFVN